MPLPFSEVVRLTGPERARLEALIRAGSTPQALVFRCRIILRAAAEDHPTNLQIAAEFHCNRHTVGAWRNRYLQQGLAGLRPGRPRRFSPLATAGGHRHGQQHDGRTWSDRHALEPR